MQSEEVVTPPGGEKRKREHGMTHKMINEKTEKS